MCRFRSELLGTEFDLSDMIVGQAVHALLKEVLKSDAQSTHVLRVSSYADSIDK